MSRSAALRRTITSTWPGAFAQALTFANLFVPIVLGSQQQLVVLVQSTAVAAILVQTVTHAAPGRLPAIASPVEARQVRKFALLTSGLTAGLIAVAALCVPAGTFSEVLWGGSLVLAGQALYTINIAELVRKYNYRGIMRARLAYAIPLIVMTTLACLLDLQALLLAAVAAVSFAVGGIVAGAAAKRSNGDVGASRSVGGQPSERGVLNVGVRAYFRELKAAAPLSLAYLLGGFSGQAGALAIPALGQVQAIWAALIRVMNGMQTVGSQFLAPKADIDLSRAVRGEGTRSASAALRAALIMAVGLAAGAVVLGIAAVMVSDPTDLFLLVDPALACALLGYVALNAGLSVIGRSLGIVGQHRARLLWEVLRVIALGTSLIFARGDVLLYLLGGFGIASCVTYFLLCRQAANAARSGSRDGRTIDV